MKIKKFFILTLYLGWFVSIVYLSLILIQASFYTRTDTQKPISKSQIFSDSGDTRPKDEKTDLVGPNPAATPSAEQREKTEQGAKKEAAKPNPPSPPPTTKPPATTTPPPNPPEPSYYIVPVIYLPSDVSFDINSYRSQVDTSFQAVRAFYSSQLGGKTFNLKPAIVYISPLSEAEHLNKYPNPTTQIWYAGVKAAAAANGYETCDEHYFYYFITTLNNVVGGWVGPKILAAVLSCPVPPRSRGTWAA